MLHKQSYYIAFCKPICCIVRLTLLNSRFHFHYESVLLYFAFYLKVAQNRKDSNVKMSIHHTYASGNKTKGN